MKDWYLQKKLSQNHLILYMLKMIFVMTFSSKKEFAQVIITCKWSLGQGNVFTHVCHSVHSGGLPPKGVYIEGVEQTPRVCLQGGLHPGGSTRPPPEIHGILWDTVNKRAVRILLLECFLVLLDRSTVNYRLLFTNRFSWLLAVPATSHYKSDRFVESILFQQFFS